MFSFVIFPAQSLTTGRKSLPANVAKTQVPLPSKHFTGRRSLAVGNATTAANTTRDRLSLKPGQVKPIVPGTKTGKSDAGTRVTWDPQTGRRCVAGNNKENKNEKENNAKPALKAKTRPEAQKTFSKTRTVNTKVILTTKGPNSRKEKFTNVTAKKAQKNTMKVAPKEIPTAWAKTSTQQNYQKLVNRKSTAQKLKNSADEAHPPRRSILKPKLETNREKNGLKIEAIIEEEEEVEERMDVAKEKIEKKETKKDRVEIIKQTAKSVHFISPGTPKRRGTPGTPRVSTPLKEPSMR